MHIVGGSRLYTILVPQLDLSTLIPVVASAAMQVTGNARTE